MRAILLLSRRMLRRNKGFIATIIAALTLPLTVFIAMFSVTLETGSLTTAMHEAIYGQQDAIILNITARPDASPEPGCIGYYTVYGLITSPNEALCVGTGDQTALELSNHMLLEGHMPTNSDEMAVEYAAAASMGWLDNLGETIEFELHISTESSFDTVITMQMRLCGIFETYSSIHVQWPMERERLTGIEQLPSILVMESDAFTPTALHALAKDIDTAYSQLFGVPALNVFLSDTYKLPSLYDSDQINYERWNANVITTACILAGIFAAFLWIIFMVLYTMRIVKAFPSLAQLGMSMHQLRTLMTIQLFAICVAVILMSAILSRGVLWVITQILKATLSYSYQWTMSSCGSMVALPSFLLLGLMFSLLISLVTVRGFRMTHRRSLLMGWVNNTINSRRRKTLHKHSAESLILSREASQKPGQFVISVLAIAVCLLVMTSMAQSYMSSSSRHSSSCDIQLTENFSTYMSTLQIPISKTGFTTTQMEELMINPDICDKLYMSEHMMNFVLYENDRMIFDIFFANLIELFRGTENDRPEILRHFGFNETDTVYNTSLFGLPDDAYHRYEEYTVWGEMRKDAVMLLVPEELAFQADWASLVNRNMIWSSIKNPESEEPERVIMELTLSAVVVIPTEDTLQNQMLDEYCFITGVDTLELMQIPVLFNRVYLSLEDPAAETPMLDKQINALLSGVTHMKYSSNRYASAAARSEQAFGVTLTLCIMVPLFGMAFFMIFINHITKMQEKKELFIQLYAMGMSIRQLNRYLVSSYVRYLLASYTIYVLFLVVLSVFDPWFSTRMNLGVYILNGVMATVFFISCLPIWVLQAKWLSRFLAINLASVI